MSENKFLVIGSNSFSGSHFVKKALTSDFDVIGISRSKEPLDVFLPYKWRNQELDGGNSSSNFQFEQFDLNINLVEILKIIDSFKPSYIVNFASQGMVAESWLNPTHWYKTNVVSQVALHDELRKKSFIKKYIHVTTPEVYGSTEGIWIDEKFKFNPSTPYAVSRAACDMHLMSFYNAYNFPVVFTRAANVFGPGQQLYRIIPITILSALSGKRMNLHGGGNSIRSFIHINDVVEATLKLALKAEPGTTWHLSTNESISIKDLVKKICELCNTKFEDVVNPYEDRLGKDMSYLLDSSAIRNNFDWCEKIKLEDGIKETISWIEKNFKILSQVSWEYHHKI